MHEIYNVFCAKRAQGKLTPFVNFNSLNPNNVIIFIDEGSKEIKLVEYDDKNLSPLYFKNLFLVSRKDLSEFCFDAIKNMFEHSPVVQILIQNLIEVDNSNQGELTCVDGNLCGTNIFNHLATRLLKSLCEILIDKAAKAASDYVNKACTSDADQNLSGNLQEDCVSQNT